MPRRRHRAPDVVEQDFLDGLARLKAGIPQHPKHKEWMKTRGSVSISISTVAREAGRSRALIAGKDSHYQNVRQLVLAATGEPAVEPENRQDVIADLRAQVAELRVELRSAQEHAAFHFKLRTEAERRAVELKGRYDRLYKNARREGGRRDVVRLFPEG